MNTQERKDLFGMSRMGYIVIESEKLSDWRRFCEQGLGMHVACDEPNQLAFRLDHHARRIIINKGPSEDIAAVGWHIQDADTLQILLARLRERGVQIQQGSAAEATNRGVAAFWRLLGPKAMPLELFIQPHTTEESLRMLCSGFITDDCGMGHMAIVSRKPERMQAFWQEIFDARLSDYIEQPMSGAMLDITFLRVNPRHHSVAIAATRGLRMDPIRTKIQHFNIEAATLDDLSAAYTRCKKLGYAMAHGIGQHPNDRELSFYVLTPSGFEMELGWDPIAVNEQQWKPVTHDGISLWGHKPEDVSSLNRLKEIQIGLRSLLHPEYSPF